MAKLDVKAKTAVWAVIVIFLVMIVLVARQSVVMLTPEATVAAPTPDSSDELVIIGGHSLLLKHGSTGARLAHWAHAGVEDSRAFEVGDQFFQPASGDLTGEGARRADIFANLAIAAPAMKTRIFPSAFGSDRQLTERRMRGLRDALVARGVAPKQVVVSAAPITGGKELADNRPEIVLVLSK